MRRRAALLAVILAAAITPSAFAAKPDPRVTRLPIDAATATSPPESEALCTLGITGPAAFSVDYLLPPNDAYYLRVRPTRCSGCIDSAGVWISSIQLTLDFPVACAMPVSFGLVRPKGDSLCAPPDPAALIRGPLGTNLIAATPGVHAFTLPLGQPTAIGLDTYLRIVFPSEGAGCAGDGMRPRFVTTSSCTLCVAWNYYPSDSADMCALQLPGLPLISAPADSCFRPGVLGVGEAPRTPFSLRVSPNPTWTDADVQLVLAQAERVRVDVCDIAGRRVRSLFAGALDAGVRSLRWDGRDDRGARLRSGLYFVSVRSPRGEQARAVVLAR